VVINKIKYPSQHLGKTQLKHKVHSYTKTFCSKAVDSGSSTASCLYTPNPWVNSCRNPCVGRMLGWVILGMISGGCTRSLLWVMTQFFMNSVDASFHLGNSSDENFVELVNVWFFFNNNINNQKLLIKFAWFLVWLYLNNFRDIFKYNYLIFKTIYFTSFLITIFYSYNYFTPFFTYQHEYEKAN
jgi:hypothetical protein